MGLGMRLENGRSFPELLCDKCGEPIRDLRDAAVQWNWPEPFREPALVPAAIYHKGDCNRDDREEAWEDARNFLPWLLWNNEWGKRLQEGTHTAVSMDTGRAVIMPVPTPLEVGP